TVAYAAPEQFRGQTTVQSDIYSLGVVLFQMLTGELPFKGETLSSLVRMHEETPPPLERLDWASAGLRDLVGRCLEKEPGKRFADPEALPAALRHVRGGTSVSEPDDTWLDQTMTRLVSQTMLSGTYESRPPPSEATSVAPSTAQPVAEQPPPRRPAAVSP